MQEHYSYKWDNRCIKMVRGPTETAYVGFMTDFCATPLTVSHPGVHFQRGGSSLFDVLTCAIAEDKSVCGQCQTKASHLKEKNLPTTHVRTPAPIVFLHKPIKPLLTHRGLSQNIYQHNWFLSGYIRFWQQEKANLQGLWFEWTIDLHSRDWAQSNSGGGR